MTAHIIVAALLLGFLLIAVSQLTPAKCIICWALCQLGFHEFGLFKLEETSAPGMFIAKTLCSRCPAVRCVDPDHIHPMRFEKA